MNRPHPPKQLLIDYQIEFVPAPDLVEWLQFTFFNKKSELYNPEHLHLHEASFGALWTNAENSRGGNTVVGTAEMGLPPSSLGKWAKARWLCQVHDWFGRIPDFILTFYALYLGVASDLSFCATVEHEILHCGQAIDEWGAPKFTKEGYPKYTLKGHDVEEHVSIVRRYGAAAGAGKTLELVEAASRPPIIGAAKILGACGNCKK